MFLKKW